MATSFRITSYNVCYTKLLRNADSESEVSYPDVSVRPILENQHPVTTAPEVEDEP